MRFSKAEPFQEFYVVPSAKGMKPEMARLTLAQNRCDHVERLEERSALRRQELASEMEGHWRDPNVV